MGLYVHQNREVIAMLRMLHKLSDDILNYRIDRVRRVLIHDDGRTWPVPDDWNLDTTDGALAARSKAEGLTEVQVPVRWCKTHNDGAAPGHSVCHGWQFSDPLLGCVLVPLFYKDDE